MLTPLASCASPNHGSTSTDRKSQLGVAEQVWGVEASGRPGPIDARRFTAAVVALDLSGIDTTTPSGQMFAGMSSVFASFERALISERTKAALAAKRAQGVRLGRPPAVSPQARDRIVALRTEGLAWRAVADAMIAEGWQTGHDGTWLANTVRRIYLTEQEHAPALAS